MEWEESKHPRDSDGRFSKGGGESGRDDLIVELKDEPPTVIEPSDVLHRDRYKRYPTIRVSSAEYEMVRSEIATNVSLEEHEKPTIKRSIRNHTYWVEVLGYGNYRIIGRMPIVSSRPKKKGERRK